MQFDHTLRIVLVGYAQVGKTTVLNILADGPDIGPVSSFAPPTPAVSMMQSDTALSAAVSSASMPTCQISALNAMRATPGTLGETEFAYFKKIIYSGADQPVTVLLWDVPNAVRHPEFFNDKLGRQEALLKFASACIVVYDSTNLDTLKDYYETCKRASWLPDKALLPVLFIGFKNDLPGAKDWREKILKMSGGYKNCIFVNRTNTQEIRRAFSELIEKSIEAAAAAIAKYLIGNIEK